MFFSPSPSLSASVRHCFAHSPSPAFPISQFRLIACVLSLRSFYLAPAIFPALCCFLPLFLLPKPLCVSALRLLFIFSTAGPNFSRPCQSLCVSLLFVSFCRGRVLPCLCLLAPRWATRWLGHTRWFTKLLQCRPSCLPSEWCVITSSKNTFLQIGT